MEKEMYRLCEVMIDISQMAGYMVDNRAIYGLDEDIDSRQLVSDIISWAQEFETVHADANFDDFEKYPQGYIGAADDFARRKMLEHYSAPALYIPPDEGTERYMVLFELCGSIGVNAQSEEEAREIVDQIAPAKLLVHLDGREVTSVTDMGTQTTICY